MRTAAAYFIHRISITYRLKQVFVQYIIMILYENININDIYVLAIYSVKKGYLEIGFYASSRELHGC